MVQEIEEEECWCDVFSEEILPRLPAKQLQRLKIVCKNWYQIISSPYFGELQLKMYNERRIIVLIPRQDGMITEFNIRSGVEETKRIPYPPGISHRASWLTILGSCDGLLCLRFGGLYSTVGVYNPSTGKSLWAPNDYYVISCSWFGHHPCSGEYVLVLVNFDDEVGVYKFNNHGSSLEKIQSTSCCCTNRRVYLVRHEERIGTLLHGALHWPVVQSNTSGLANLDFGFRTRQYVISAYHLGDNKCLEISPPLQVPHFRLRVVDGCLFAFFKATQGCEYEMWIMKEYGVQQSWTKYATIQGFNWYRNLIPLEFFPNGDLILDVDECKLIKYNFNDNKHVLLMNHRIGVPIMCADSLVSPQIVGT